VCEHQNVLANAGAQKVKADFETAGISVFSIPGRWVPGMRGGVVLISGQSEVLGNFFRDCVRGCRGSRES
jgi:hypothetical protein